MSLAHGRVETRLPAEDLARAECWHAEVTELRRRAVVFEDYGIPGLAMSNNIVDIPDNYPSKGRAECGAWFRDSEGNMLGIGQAIR